MATAREYALYFMQKNLDTTSNTFDGNMKLQKLLLFADLVNLSEYGTPLFKDKILAFRNGCVVENVRLEYRNNFPRLKKDSAEFTPKFSDEDRRVLDLTIELFGGLTARQLSELNHQFYFWKQAYARGTSDTGRHDKKSSQVDIADMKAEIDKIDSVISAYRNSDSAKKYELINGIKFYYDPNEVLLTDSITDELEEFSLQADENAYTVYYDDGKLVVY